MQPHISAGYLVNHLARQFAILLAKDLEPLGISPAQFPILLTLWEKDGLSQNELVEIADLRQATIANTLARMERDGLIERKAHPSDARSRLIFLSEKAKNLQEQATQIAKNINAGALSVLTDDEQAMFILMMNKVMAQQKRMIAQKP
ncbi:MarR family winged helix-turn-helix transcriptional regulator [Moraxella cuniculi]|uniref:Organic hydroperoxide resistance transcriptional regulator n=1 Tax=Moraxella cuniculi TaxID=34061 RepID=A0A448GXC3_9GAMM|nr:MarR family transcriptional regulator [Moraxella cuniculi]VEG13450.1 Organic hydroperoxide resistance transcriptional regulator [Moraxella cuniculi]